MAFSAWPGSIFYVAFKARKGQMQKSRGNPADAEANVVAAVRGIAAGPKRNGAVVGIIDDVTAS